MPWSDLLRTAVAMVVLGLPLGISMWALLDAARRPQWAWSLADRNQALWIAVVLLGVLSLLGGLAVSSWYLLRVRPVVAAAERGDIPERPRRRLPGE